MLRDKDLQKHIESDFIETKFESPGIYKYGETSDKFYYSSPEGLIAQNDTINNNLEVGELHFAPFNIDTGERVSNMSYVPKDEKEHFRRRSVIQLIKALANFIEFLDNHPDSRIAKVKYFNGHTNKEMANFISTRLKIDSKPTVDPITKKLVYYFYASIDEIKEGFNELNSSHPNIVKLLETSN